MYFCFKNICQTAFQNNCKQFTFLKIFVVLAIGTVALSLSFFYLFECSDVLFFTVIYISLITGLFAHLHACEFVHMDSLFTTFTHFPTGLLVSCQFLGALCILVMTANSLSVISFATVFQNLSFACQFCLWSLLQHKLFLIFVNSDMAIFPFWLKNRL